MTIRELRNDWLIRVTEKLVVLWSFDCCFDDFFKILSLLSGGETLGND